MQYIGKQTNSSLEVLLIHYINEGQTIPNFKSTTFFCFINDIGFYFKKKRNNALLQDRSNAIAMRHDYLREIRKF